MAYFHTTVLDNQIKALPTTDTASGSIATFNTDLTENLVEVKCQIVAKQASGTPSPDNPLPITTYTEMNVGLNGKNYLPSVENDTKSNNGIEITTLNGVFTISGTATGGSANITFNLDTPYKIKSGDYLHFMNNSANGSAVLTIQRQNGTAIGAPSITPINRILDISSYAGEVIYSFRFYIANGTNFDCTMSPMITKDNIPTTFEPYNGTTANIQFGQTVANGVLDINSGKLRVTGVTKNISDMYFDSLSTPASHIFRSNYVQYLTGIKCPDTNNELIGSISEQASEMTYTAISASDNGKYAFSIESTNRFVMIDTACSTVSDFITEHGNDKIVYPLATPLIIQLDSITLQALLNENNVWCDTGDTEVKFLLTVGKKIS